MSVNVQKFYELISRKDFQLLSLHLAEHGEDIFADGVHIFVDGYRSSDIDTDERCSYNYALAYSSYFAKNPSFFIKNICVIRVFGMLTCNLYELSIGKQFIKDVLIQNDPKVIVNLLYPDNNNLFLFWFYCSENTNNNLFKKLLSGDVEKKLDIGFVINGIFKFYNHTELKSKKSTDKKKITGFTFLFEREDCEEKDEEFVVEGTSTMKTVKDHDEIKQYHAETDSKMEYLLDVLKELDRVNVISENIDGIFKHCCDNVYKKALMYMDNKDITIEHFTQLPCKEKVRRIQGMPGVFVEDNWKILYLGIHKSQKKHFLEAIIKSVRNNKNCEWFFGLWNNKSIRSLYKHKDILNLSKKMNRDDIFINDGLDWFNDKFLSDEVKNNTVDYLQNKPTIFIDWENVSKQTKHMKNMASKCIRREDIVTDDFELTEIKTSRKQSYLRRLKDNLDTRKEAECPGCRIEMDGNSITACETGNICCTPCYKQNNHCVSGCCPRI